MLAPGVGCDLIGLMQEETGVFGVCVYCQIVL